MPASDRTQRELMGHFTLYNMGSFQFADLMSCQPAIIAATGFTVADSDRDLIPDIMVY